MAMSHLARRACCVRAMSGRKRVRMRDKSGLSQGKFELPEISQLNLLLRADEMAVTKPTTVSVRQPDTYSGRDNIHMSAAYGLTNNIVSIHSSQQVDSLPSLHSLCCAAQDPLFQQLFTSLAAHSQYYQHRGFKTKRSERAAGSEVSGDSFLDRIKGSFGKKKSQKTFSGGGSKKLSESGGVTDENIDIVRKAFSEGYEEARKKKSNNSNIRNFLIFVCVVYFLWRFVKIRIRTTEQNGDGGRKKKRGGIFSMLDNQQYEVFSEEISTTFADVRGADEAKQELQDVVNFLKNPDKYTSLGAKLPKGVLLIGPPGVGKTLLARAVAGETGVPFFQASGSEFDEMFVGMGAQRIRKLFTAAKEQAPCIIFIDEFDSVGAKRTSSAIHPYANQTVNQLLNEMDGFTQNEGIIVMGATNKVNNLDKALRRPGRFDVEVTVALPDLKSRLEIIDLYIGKIQTDASVDVNKLARGTTGFSGAMLENLVNTAALKAVIDGKEVVSMEHLEHARDKILMGPEKHRIPDETTNWVTAFHEAGHTLVAYYTKDAQPLHKVTIIPRGQSLGHTAFMDEKEAYNRTMSQIKAFMDVGMGGRAAEDIIYGMEKVTTGAASDLQRTTQLASAMVMANGMSEKVGQRVFRQRHEGGQELSPAQREAIDSEIKRLLQESYERARAILTSHRKELDNLAKTLVEYETLDKDEIKAVIEGKKLNRVI